MITTAWDCVNYLRKIKSTMPRRQWKKWIKRIIAGAEGKDDW